MLAMLSSSSQLLLLLLLLPHACSINLPSHCSTPAAG
jgi:hypothetical protein